MIQSSPSILSLVCSLNKPAGVQQNLVTLVLFGVEHVVALLAEPYSHKARPLRHGGVGSVCCLLFEISVLLLTLSL